MPLASQASRYSDPAIQAQSFKPLFAAPRFRAQQPDPFGRDRDTTPWDHEIPLPDEGKALEAARSAWRSGASLRDLFGDAATGITATGIHGSIGKTNGRNRPGDVFKLQSLLHKLGYRDAAGTDGPTGYLGSFDHEPIMAFQRDHGLKPDGMLEPGGETIRALQNFAQQPDIAGGPANAVVQVRAYQQTRDGKTVQVAAHERGAPDGGAPGNGASTPNPKAAGIPGSSRDNPKRKIWSDKPLPPMISPVPNPTIRSQSSADGVVKSIRTTTNRETGQITYREHAGLDLDVKPGEEIISPVDGVFVTEFDPYSKDKKLKKKVTAVQIRTPNGDTIDILYAKQKRGLKNNQPVRQGEPIGVADDVRNAHGSAMDPHIHLQVKDRNDAFKDPTAAIGAKRRPTDKRPNR